MIASIVQLLIDALSQNNVENTSACADVTQLTMAECNKTRTSPTTKLLLMYMDMVMILKRYIHAERAGLWEEYLAELDNMLVYLVSAGRCKYVSCLPLYLEAMIGLPTLALNILRWTYHLTSNRSLVQWCLERHDIREYIQP